MLTNVHTCVLLFPFLCVYITWLHGIGKVMYFTYYMIKLMMLITFYNMTDRDKFVYLMKKHWKQLSQYIEAAWDYRNSILYKQT